MPLTISNENSDTWPVHPAGCQAGKASRVESAGRAVDPIQRDNLPQDERRVSMSLEIKFKVKGNVRHLSHAETLTVFRRACARANIAVQYSRGFNPHPRLSLPLPRSVGLESSDERLRIRICGEPDLAPGGRRAGEYESWAQAALSEQLPADLEVLSAKLVRADTELRPCMARYALQIRGEDPETRANVSDTIRAKTEYVLESESLYVTRTSGPAARGKKGSVKKMDVRPFLQSIQLEEGRFDPRLGDECPALMILVECRISPAGSIRVDEILRILEVDREKLAAPVRRVYVQWEQEES